MDLSFVKLCRKIVDWEWYKELVTFKVFLHLLIIANYKDTRWHGIEIKRGQCIIGLRSCADAAGVSVQSLRTALERLKSTHEITTQPTHQYSIITICNYERYQSTEGSINTPINQQINMPSTHDQHTINTIQEVKKVRMEEKEKKDFVELALDIAASPKQSERQKLVQSARVIIAYLNEQAGRQYREVDAHLTPIMARLAEVNNDVEGVKQMIDRQVAKWKDDPGMMEYLRPATLFARSNFHDYYDSRTMPFEKNGKVVKMKSTSNILDTIEAMMERDRKSGLLK